MVERIITYTPEFRDAIEEFRAQTFAEGNTSLSHAKFDPDALDGRIWMAFEDDKLVSISAAEVSHYTGERDVIRKCRYHILKAYRHGRYGFKFLREMVPWCADQGHRLLYWTHDVQNVPLNALYQRRKTYAFSEDNDWFHQWPYTDLRFERDMLFKTGDMLQFIYSIPIFDTQLVWRPQGGGHIYYYDHDGRVVTWEQIRHAAVAAGDQKSSLLPVDDISK